MNDKEPLFWKLLSAILMLVILGSVIISFHWPWQALLFPNSDFEYGDLRNWVAEGDAFQYQPTFGDNSVARNGVGSSGLQGNFWVGSFEKRQKLSDPQGIFNGDPPMGKLTSIPFKIARSHIAFLLGGGNGSNTCGVALEVNGERVLFEPGRGQQIWNERMGRITWDVLKWRGKEARIVIIDNTTGPWGHVNADDFRYA